MSDKQSSASVSIFVPASRHSAQSEAIIIPARCCLTGLSPLLLRAAEDFIAGDTSETPLIELPVASDRTVITAKAVRLVVEYLEHFSPSDISLIQKQRDNIARQQKGSGSETPSNVDPKEAEPLWPQPTALPTPLPTALENLLTPWENTFIASRLLGNHGDAWEHNDLMAVLRAAQFLQVTSLEAMCLAWCASQMTKMCDLTTKYSEAAEMMRKFFGIHNDWTAEEEECLRIENEWPEDEL